MQFRTVAVVAVALLVALSGCSALEELNADGPSNETTADADDLEDAESDASADDAESGDETGTDGRTEGETGTGDGTGDGSETDGTDGDTETDDGDDTADAEWHPPEEPNKPLERKDENRIESVEFVDKEPAADGEGYSNFNLKVVANTSMENVDPPEYGDVIGEPYFFVKINEGPGERKIVERTGQVRMAENGTYHIDVRPAGIEEFGDGPLTVEVYLMDEDKDMDDVYDAVGETIHFNPDTDADGSETVDDSETSDSTEADDSETSDGTETEDSETSDGSETNEDADTDGSESTEDTSIEDSETDETER